MLQEIISKTMIMMRMKATYSGKVKMTFKMMASRRISWRIITETGETVKVKGKIRMGFFQHHNLRTKKKYYLR